MCYSIMRCPRELTNKVFASLAFPSVWGLVKFCKFFRPVKLIEIRISTFSINYPPMNKIKKKYDIKFSFTKNFSMVIIRIFYFCLLLFQKQHYYQRLKFSVNDEKLCNCKTFLLRYGSFFCVIYIIGSHRI